MTVALRVGGSPTPWLEDPRALATAVEVLNDADRRRR